MYPIIPLVFSNDYDYYFYENDGSNDHDDMLIVEFVLGFLSFSIMGYDDDDNDTGWNVVCNNAANVACRIIISFVYLIWFIIVW